MGMAAGCTGTAVALFADTPFDSLRPFKKTVSAVYIWFRDLNDRYSVRYDAFVEPHSCMRKTFYSKRTYTGHVPLVLFST